jgi:putative transposase
LAVVIDLFSRQVVGWAVADHMRTSLFVSTLQMAFWRRKPKPGLRYHSDRGSQTASHEYRKHLAIMKWDRAWTVKAIVGTIPRQNVFFEALSMNSLITKDSGPKHQPN